MSDGRPMDEAGAATTRDAPAVKPPRLWRPMALWTAGILLVLGLIWFVAAVAVPVWQTRAVVLRREANFSAPALQAEIGCLGGPGLTLRRLSLYTRLPERIAPRQDIAVMMLGACGEAAFPELVRLLKEAPWDQTRSCAAKELGKIGNQDAVGPLLAALNDPDPSTMVCCSAVNALGELKDHRAVEPLMGMLGHWYECVRGCAAESLGEIGDNRAVDALVALLKDTHEYPRTAAAKALGKLGDPRAVGPLVNALQDHNSDACAAAAEALGRLGDPRAVEPLKELLARRQEFVVSYHAAEALKKIRGEEPPK